MTELIMTTAERMRMDLDQRIAKEFKDMAAAYPGASTARIIRSIAASGKFTTKSFSGIRCALIRTGTIIPETRKS